MESKCQTDVASSILPSETDVRKLYYPRPRKGQIKEWKWDEKTQELCVFDTQVKEEEYVPAGTPTNVVTSLHPPSQECFADVESLDRSTIEVQGLSAPNCAEMCRSYFENPALSGGGHIFHLSVDEDKKIVFITFESWEDAERVTSRSHVINGCHVTVNQCITPKSTYPNMLLLKNVGEITTKDQVSMYMENISGFKPCEILLGEQPGVVIVKFEEHINFKIMKEPCDTIKLQGRQLSVSEVPISNCVLVKNLAPGTTQGDLVDYFENMSDVGSLEKVEMMPSKNKCLVYFEDIEVIDYVLTQTHTINGRKLNLQHYFELPGPLCTGQTYDFIKPKSFCINNIDQDKMAIIKLSSNVRDDFSHQLLTLHTQFQIVEKALIVDCMLTSSVPMAYALARTWSHFVQVTVKKYMTQLEIYKMKTLSYVWSEAVKAVNEMKQITPDVSIASLHAQENVFVVFGKAGTRNLFQQIVSVVENIEIEMGRKNTKVRETDKSFQEYQLRLLQAVSISAKVCRQYKDLSIDICMNEREVTLTGTLKDVKEVLVEMVKFLQLVKHYTINDLSSTFRLILCSSETRGLLQEKLKDEHVTAVWEEEKDNIVVYAFSRRECLKATLIIRAAVVNYVFGIKGGESILQMLKSDEWNALALKLMNAHPGKLNLSHTIASKMVLLTLTLTKDILDIVKANIRHFFQNHVFSEEYSFSPSRQKFVSLFWKDKLAAITSSLMKHNVEVTLAEEVGVICAQGTGEGLDLLKKQLQALADQIICHVTTVDDQLKVKFLTTEDCAKQMDIFERSSQCVLGMSEEPNVIQVSTSSDTVDVHTSLSSCSTGQGKFRPHSGANQTSCSKLLANYVAILDGNIANQQVDIIVNSTRHDLNLNSGGVSAAILAKGGQGLQNECRAKYPKGIQTQDIARTLGHGLPCKEVFHVALCPFQTQNAQQILETVVSKCLIEANKSRYTSIAFPALGVGVLGYPSDIVSKTMHRAMDAFLKNTSVITITSIKVIIFNDTEMIKDFQRVFSDPGMQTTLASKRQDGYVRQSHVDNRSRKAFKVETFWSGFMECVVGDLRLVVKPGDVTEEEVDAIVNSTNNKLDLNGTVSTMLRTKCGDAFMKECRNKVTEIQDKGVCVTKAFNLKSKVILHFNLNKFQPDRLSEGLETLLKEAERCHVSTIALPAIGTGAGRISPAFLAEAIFQALVNFSKIKVQNIKEVRVVLFDDVTLPPFVSQIQEESEKHRAKKRGIVKLLKGKTDNSSSSQSRLSNTLHQVAKLYIYTADRNNVKRLLDDFGGVVTRKFMRTIDTASHDPVPYIKKRGSLPPVLTPTSGSSSSNDNLNAVLQLPTSWAAHGPNERVKRVLLPPSHDEYKTVVKSFKASLNISVKIISVERIQNPTLYTMYSVKKVHIEKQNSDIPGIHNEKTLWHGTTTKAIDNINHHGFNRSYCGKNAIVYGEGVYFAVNSAYSANLQYSTPDTSGKRYIYQCKVLSGCPTMGDNKMKVLPSRSGVVLYDSATDDLDKPNLYVIFNDHQAYPEYLITFEGSD